MFQIATCMVVNTNTCLAGFLACTIYFDSLQWLTAWENVAMKSIRLLPPLHPASHFLCVHCRRPVWFCLGYFFPFLLSFYSSHYWSLFSVCCMNGNLVRILIIKKNYFTIRLYYSWDLWLSSSSNENTRDHGWNYSLFMNTRNILIYSKSPPLAVKYQNILYSKERRKENMTDFSVYYMKCFFFS